MTRAYGEFEPPVFKKLAKNDTGQAVGHQAGFLVPKELGVYFPELAPASVLEPAPAVGIRAILVVDGIARGTVDTVYQHQTWGGTRTPERRVTANLKPLLGSAVRDDLLLIERSIDDDFLYRFTLVRQSSVEFEQTSELTGGRSWGLLQGRGRPATVSDIQQQEAVLVELATHPFEPFDGEAETQTVKRIARGRAFRRQVTHAYDQRCAMCGGGLVNMFGKSEIEAAHIISRGALGTDDVRNGLALCRAHHWAFDQGLICVGPERKIMVRPAALVIAENAPLKLLEGRQLREPAIATHAAHQDALAWHRNRLFYEEFA